MKKRRRIHVCPPATASEIRRALRITRADLKAAQEAIKASERRGRNGST